MSKRILVLAGSPRIKGNTDILSDEFIRGAKEMGNDTEKIYLAQKKIYPCIGCYKCRSTSEHTCVFKEKDDFEEIIQKVITADVLVLASPVYFYSLTAQMKVALDRFFARENEIKNKKAYFITASAAPDEKYLQVAIETFRGFISCFENVTESGMVLGMGTTEKGDVKELPVMQQAYELGKTV